MLKSPTSFDGGINARDTPSHQHQSIDVGLIIRLFQRRSTYPTERIQKNLRQCFYCFPGTRRSFRQRSRTGSLPAGHYLRLSNSRGHRLNTRHRDRPPSPHPPSRYRPKRLRDPSSVIHSRTPISPFFPSPAQCRRFPRGKDPRISDHHADERLLDTAATCLRLHESHQT